LALPGIAGVLCQMLSGLYRVLPGAASQPLCAYCRSLPPVAGLCRSLPDYYATAKKMVGTAVVRSRGYVVDNLTINWQRHCPCDRNVTTMRTGAASPQVLLNYWFCNVNRVSPRCEAGNLGSNPSSPAWKLLSADDLAKSAFLFWQHLRGDVWGDIAPSRRFSSPHKLPTRVAGGHGHVVT
jgi:hypothetical protein